MGVDLLADLPILNTFAFYALLHRRSFHITYKRPNEVEAVLGSSSRFHTIKAPCISHITITSPHTSTENTTQHYKIKIRAPA